MEQKTSVVKKAFNSVDKKTQQPSKTSLTVEFENGDWGFFKLLKGGEHPFVVGAKVTYDIEQVTGKKYSVITLPVKEEPKEVKIFPSSFSPLRSPTSPEELKVYASIAMMSELLRSFCDDKLDMTFILDKQSTLAKALWDKVDEIYGTK